MPRRPTPSRASRQPGRQVAVEHAPATGIARLALRFTAFAERWYPDAFVFAAFAVGLVAIAAMVNGASPRAVSHAFGTGFWSLITFTLQMAFVAIGGYVVASSPSALRLIDTIARLPATGRAAIGMVAVVSMGLSLLNWGISLIFSALLVRALARRTELAMDYRAAGAAGYLGLGATWALGLSSSAAQLQANAASIPKTLLPITGVIPFTQTIFLWQSMAMAAVLIVVSALIALWSAPGPGQAVTAKEMDIDLSDTVPHSTAPRTPAEWLEHSPAISLLLGALGLGYLLQEFLSRNPISVISNLDSYNLLFLIAGLLLHWRPRSFLNAVAKAVPATGGVLIQFPLYGAVAAILTQAQGSSGHTLADQIAHAFVSLTTTDTFPVVMGLYSMVLGFFIPSGGGKWVMEAPYVMQAANDLNVNLGWAVEIYNTAEALPNLINPFWMLPLLGVLGLKARDVVGFTFVQILVHAPLVLFMLWAFGLTLGYTPPTLP